MRTIYKYPIRMVESQTIGIHALLVNGRLQSLKEQFIRVETQRGITCLWAMVDNQQPLIMRVMAIKCTGQDCEDVKRDDYLGSVNDGTFVFHVFGV